MREMKEGWKYLNFIDAYVDEGYIYASNYEYNLFFRVNVNSFEVEEICSLDGYREEESWKIRSISRYGDKLFLFSAKSYEVVSYDLNTSEVEYFHPEFERMIQDVIRAVCVVNGEAYLFEDIFKDEVCVFSMEEGTYSIRKIDISSIRKEIKSDECAYVAIEKMWVVGRQIWRCIAGTNKVVKIDLELMKAQVFTIPTLYKFFSIDYAGDGFYFSTLEASAIVHWSEEKGVDKEFSLIDPQRRGRGIYSIIGFEKSLLLLPGHNDFIEVISEKNNIQNRYDFSEKFSRIHGSKLRPSYMNYYHNNKKILLFPFHKSEK